MDIKILITGGAGFIGSHLYRSLQNDYSITVVDNLSTGNIKNLPDNAKILIKDINDLIPKDLEKIDIAFHCAALARVQPSILDPIRYHKSNVSGTLNLLDCCVKAKVKRFIFSSSSSVYGDVDILPTPETAVKSPKSPYALQKLIGEFYCKIYSDLYDLDTVCLRYFNVYGENMPTTGSYRTCIGIFIDQKKNNLPLTITGDGEQKRDFTHVDDVVSANILAMNYSKKFNGECFNIGRGKNYSVNEIAEAFNHRYVYQKAVLEPRESLANNSKAEKILNWKPTKDVIESIKNAIQ